MKQMNEVSEKVYKEIYLNILKAIIIILYFFVLNLSSEYVNAATFEIGVKVVTMLFLFISIIMIEIAYKKDSGNLAIQGIEILALATYTLTSKHITNKYDFDFKNYSLVASYLFAIYFIFKSIVIYTKGRKEKVQSRSDIKEILKKDEPVKKEATKKEKIVKKGNNDVAIEKKSISNKKHALSKKKNSDIKAKDKNKTKDANTNVKTKKKLTNIEENELEIQVKKKKNTTKKTNTTAKPKQKLNVEDKEVVEVVKKKKSTSSGIDSGVTKKKTGVKTGTKIVKKDGTKKKTPRNIDIDVIFQEKPKKKKVKKEVTDND